MNIGAIPSSARYSAISFNSNNHSENVKSKKSNSTVALGAIGAAAAIGTASVFAYKRGKIVNEFNGNESKLLSNLKEGFKTFFGKGKELYNNINLKGNETKPIVPSTTQITEKPTEAKPLTIEEIAKLRSEKEAKALRQAEISQAVEEAKIQRGLSNKSAKESAHFFEQSRLEDTQAQLDKIQPLQKTILETGEVQLGQIKFKPITSDEEFEQVFDRLTKQEFWREEWTVPNAPKIQQAINPYAGFADFHSAMNHYLLTGELQDGVNAITNEKDMKDLIRMFEYALEKCDEKYGTYDGVVFRTRPLPYEKGRYVSTSKDMKAPGRVSQPFRILDEDTYEIIYAKDGHRICDIQKEMAPIDKWAKYYHEMEDEILLSPNHKFVEITDLTPEQEALVLDYAYAIAEAKQCPGWQNTIRNQIRVFRQV